MTGPAPSPPTTTGRRTPTGRRPAVRARRLDDARHRRRRRRAGPRRGDVGRRRRSPGRRPTGSVPDGTYRWVLQATDDWGNGPLEDGWLRRRRHRAAGGLARGRGGRRSRLFTPNGDGSRDSVGFAVGASEPGRVIADVRDAADQVVDHVIDDRRHRGRHRDLGRPRQGWRVRRGRPLHARPSSPGTGPATAARRRFDPSTSTARWAPPPAPGPCSSRRTGTTWPGPRRSRSGSGPRRRSRGRVRGRRRRRRPHDPHRARPWRPAPSLHLERPQRRRGLRAARDVPHRGDRHGRHLGRHPEGDRGRRRLPDHGQRLHPAARPEDHGHGDQRRDAGHGRHGCASTSRASPPGA